MITMRGAMARGFLAVLLAWSTSIPASAEEWEVQIVASTPDGAENSLYFGQKPDATDGYDSRYEVRAMLGGSIEAYFPHAEWDVLAERFWRDIKAPDQTKSWVFEVNTALDGTETRLKWNPLKIPAGYAVELTDMAQHTLIDMTSQSEHYFYPYSGPRQFTINIEAPETPAIPVFLDSPSGLDGAWGEGNTVIHLTWTDNSEGESGFMLERKVPGEPWTLLASLDANTTAYSDYSVVDSAEEEKNRLRDLKGQKKDLKGHRKGLKEPIKSLKNHKKNQIKSLKDQIKDIKEEVKYQKKLIKGQKKDRKEQIRDQIKDLKDQIKDIRDQIKDIRERTKDQIRDIKDQIKDIKEQIKDVKEQIKDTKEQIKVQYLYKVKAYNSLMESEFSNTKPIK